MLALRVARRAVSSAVRASRLHREGPRFKSVTAHHCPFISERSPCSAGDSLSAWRRHPRRPRVAFGRRAGGPSALERDPRPPQYARRVIVHRFETPRCEAVERCQPAQRIRPPRPGVFAPPLLEFFEECQRLGLRQFLQIAALHDRPILAYSAPRTGPNFRAQFGRRGEVRYNPKRTNCFSRVSSTLRGRSSVG